MKTVFHADHVTEAHLVAEILKSVGIRPFINGGMLQGAMGELPAAGLVTVSVIDDDAEEAIAAIKDQYSLDDSTESEQSEDARPHLKPGLDPA
jgi:hypothetical protein